MANLKLNELLGKKRLSDTVSQINVNGLISSDNVSIANHFNEFFTGVGEEISNSIPPVDKNPEDYIDYGRPIPPPPYSWVILHLNM
jgi:hypothetical protein